MPVTIKSGQVKVKGTNGYVSVDALADSTTASRIAAIEAAGTEAVGDVQDEGAAQVAAIEAAGAEVMADIPEDYTELSGDVSDLKSAFEAYEGGTTGQVLRKKSNADNDVEWASVGQPTDEQTAEAVSSWLDEHPEATTTVQDGSLTESKFTAQTILDYKNYVATPQMYGAKGNGIADDTQAIQDALDENIKVFFPQGTYKITEPLVLRNGQTIEGASKYYSTIYAVGCDGIHLTNGDHGERGDIYNINIRSDKTADAKGIKISTLAPGWTFQDVWIDSFDYGIYAYRVNVNNYYITRCIITGHSTPAVRTCKYGIFLQNSTSGQVNANFIRECEINNFKVGVAISGTCNGVLQNTIQNNEFGIVVDDDIPIELGDNPFNTSALTINGNYMELVMKAGIYFNLKTFSTGVQITNNYIFKPNNSDANYGAIHLNDANHTYGRIAGNINAPTGFIFSSYFVGMNYLSVPSGSKPYIVESTLSADSVLMASNAGVATNTKNIWNKMSPMLTGARIISAYEVSKKITTFYNEKTWWNNNVTMVDEKNALMNTGGVIKMYFKTNLVNISDIAAKLADYGEDNKYVNIWMCYRSREDGKLYSDWNHDGDLSSENNRCIEDMNLANTYLGSWRLKSSDVQSDGYCHRNDLFSTTYHGSQYYSYNSISEYVLLFVSHFDGITVHAPTIGYLLGTE